MWPVYCIKFSRHFSTKEKREENDERDNNNEMLTFFSIWGGHQDETVSSLRESYIVYVAKRESRATWNLNISFLFLYEMRLGSHSHCRAIKVSHRIIIIAAIKLAKVILLSVSINLLAFRECYPNRLQMKSHLHIWCVVAVLTSVVWCCRHHILRIEIGMQQFPVENFLKGNWIERKVLLRVSFDDCVTISIFISVQYTDIEPLIGRHRVQLMTMAIIA